MEINEKLDFIEKVKISIETLKKAGVKAFMDMGIRDKVYFAVQKVIQSFNQNSIGLLGSGAEYTQAEEKPTVQKKVNIKRIAKERPWDLTPEQLAKISNPKAIEAMNAKVAEINKVEPEKEEELKQ